MACSLLGCCAALAAALALAAFAATAADDGGGASALASAAACPGHNVAPVANALRYTGPAQRVLREGRHNFRCFPAQHYEDLWLFQHVFNGAAFDGSSNNNDQANNNNAVPSSGGTFVELGALDGYSYSVSYFFERFLGWRGLLIEASPQNVASFKFKSSRMRAQRRRDPSQFVHAAVCDDDGKGVTYVSKEGTGAGILEFMPEDQQRRNRRMCETRPPSAVAADRVAAGGDDASANNGSTAATAANKQRGDGGDTGTAHGAAPVGQKACVLTPLRCVDLGKLLAARGMATVDLFVLDVEGAEWEVLRTLPLRRGPSAANGSAGATGGIAVRYFLIELDGKRPAKDAAVRCVLRRAGFVPVGRLDLNEVWRNPLFDAAACAARSGGAQATKATTASAQEQRQRQAQGAARWGACFQTPPGEAPGAFLRPPPPLECGGAPGSDGTALDADWDPATTAPQPAAASANGGGGNGAASVDEPLRFAPVVSLAAALWLLGLGAVLVRRRRRAGATRA